MSGGTFDYGQYHLTELISNLEDYTDTVKQEYPINVYTNHLNAITELKRIYIHIQRLDWLYAGDDGIESYNTRLNAELKEFMQTKKDERPKLDGWAPGNYTNTCQMCHKEFVGDKRAFFCAQCAYGDTNETV